MLRIKTLPQDTGFMVRVGMEHLHTRELTKVLVQIPPVVQLLPSKAILGGAVPTIPGAYLDDTVAIQTVQTVVPLWIKE